MSAICQIVQNYYDIDPRVRRKAEALVEAGYDVDVIALAMPKNKGGIYTLNGVSIHALPLRKKRGGKFWYLFEYAAFFIMATIKIASLNQKKRYVVIDVNTLPDLLVFAGLIPRIFGSKVILDMHEIMPEFFMSKYGVTQNHWLIRLISLQERVSLCFADHVMTINHPIQKLLLRRGLKSDKSTIVMNSVDQTMFNNRKDEKERSCDKFVMMYHGTLNRIYGVDIALSAFGQVHEKMPNAQFWIVGDGTERLSLERQVNELEMQDKVKFIGMIPQQEIPGWLRQCDVGVLATRQDVFLDFSFSNKLPEYIVMGKPVIVSRLAAIREYFSEDSLGYFEPHNIKELGQRMLQLYNDPEKRRILKEKSQSEYHAINWEVMKKRYLNLVSDMTG